MQKIFDAHIHLSERNNDALNRFARLNGLAYTLDELLATMKQNNIDHGLLLSPPLEERGVLSNSEILRLCKNSGTMLSPVITVEPTPKDVKMALNLARDNRKAIKAFKIRLGYIKAAAESRVFDKLYHYAESEHLPVLFHTGDTAFHNGDLKLSQPLGLDSLANKRKELIIVLCHFGNPWFDDVAELIYKHPNVYTDTSGLITGEGSYTAKYSEWLARKISEAIYYVGGADKVLFGTDYPVTKHTDALDLIRKLDIDEADKERIYWDNAERLFGP